MNPSVRPLIAKLAEGNPQLSRLFEESVKEVEVNKGDILQSPGLSVSQGFFVRNGLLRTYTIDEKGKEHTYLFAPEGWVVSDLEPLDEDYRTSLYVEALENSTIEVIDRKMIEQLEEAQTSTGEEKRRFLRRIAVLQRRVLMLMSASAAQRYKQFEQTYPQLINRVPMRMIASYLGVTPEALSKIRGELARGK